MLVVIHMTSSLDKEILKEAARGNCLSPSRRRRIISRVCELLHISERRACSVLGQVRSTQRHAPRITAEEERLRADIVNLASRYGRYGLPADYGAP